MREEIYIDVVSRVIIQQLGRDGRGDVFSYHVLKLTTPDYERESKHAKRRDIGRQAPATHFSIIGAIKITMEYMQQALQDKLTTWRKSLNALLPLCCIAPV